MSLREMKTAFPDRFPLWVSIAANPMPSPCVPTPPEMTALAEAVMRVDSFDEVPSGPLADRFVANLQFCYRSAMADSP